MADEQKPKKNQQISRATKAAVARPEPRPKAGPAEPDPGQGQQGQNPSQKPGQQSQNQDPKQGGQDRDRESPALCRAFCWVASYRRS